MDYYRKWQGHIIQIEKGEKVPENTIAYSLQPVTKVFRVWYNVEDWQKIGIPEKIVCLLIGVVLGIFWFLVFYEIRGLEPSFDNVVEICKTISVVLGGLVTVIKFFSGWTKREKLTNVIREVDRRVRLSRSHASEELQMFSIKQYLFFSKIVVGSLTIIVCMCVSIFFYTLVTGEQYYKLALPFERPPYSLAWWIEAIALQIVMSFCNLIYSFSEGMWLDIILQLAYLYRVEYEKLDSFGQSEDKDNTNFSSLCENLKALKALTDEIMNIIWAYQFNFWSFAYLSLGLAAVCLTIEAGSGVVAILGLLFYPMYVLLVAAVWSFTGTYFEEIASDINSRIYHSNWIGLSKTNKKNFIILMTFGQLTSRLEVPPLYVINREYFAEVIKKTYSLYAVVRNIFDF